MPAEFGAAAAERALLASGGRRPGVRETPPGPERKGPVTVISRAEVREHGAGVQADADGQDAAPAPKAHEECRGADGHPRQRAAEAEPSSRTWRGRAGAQGPSATPNKLPGKGSRWCGACHRTNPRLTHELNSARGWRAPARASGSLSSESGQRARWAGGAFSSPRTVLGAAAVRAGERQARGKAEPQLYICSCNPKTRSL